MAVSLTYGDYKCSLDEKTQEKAKKELFEDPKQRQSHINTLRTWLENQPHISGCRKGNKKFLLFSYVNLRTYLLTDNGYDRYEGLCL